MNGVFVAGVQCGGVLRVDVTSCRRPLPVSCSLCTWGLLFCSNARVSSAAFAPVFWRVSFAFPRCLQACGSPCALRGRGVLAVPRAHLRLRCLR